jgi:enoyl-CoA hydratase
MLRLPSSARSTSAWSRMGRRFASTYTNILTEVKNGNVALITMNRPKALNALNPEIVSELAHACVGYDADPSIGAIVVTGAGDKSFVAGADIKVMAEKSYMDMSRSRSSRR